LLFLDVSLVPMALLLVFLGILFGVVAHIGDWLPLSLFSLVVGGGLVSLTLIVWKALRASPRARRAS
jgi:hypothetical protein